MKRRIILTAGILVFAIGLTSFTSRTDAKKVIKKTTHEGLQTAQVETEMLMRLKLEEAQNLLEGIAVRDFETIRNSSEKLREISIDAQWTASNSPSYGRYGDTFRNSLDDVISMADAQNLEGCAFHYMQLIMTCVQCHERVREGQELAAIDIDTLSREGATTLWRTAGAE